MSKVVNVLLQGGAREQGGQCFVTSIRGPRITIPL